MATRPRSSSGWSAATACRASTWSSSTGPARSRCTERYLGDPNVDPEPYRRSSVLRDAASLSRPLLLIHGLADDNVVAAHTLRLSSLLLAAGRAHSVLPLSGVTHMTPQEVVASNLLLFQLAFLRAALGLPVQGAAPSA